MTTSIAKAIDGIPVVATTAERNILFPTPSHNQRVENLETGVIERYDSALGWVTSRVTRLLDVRSFGATGDGSTDDHAGILRAFAEAVTGDTVFFPRPAVRYRITDLIEIETDGVTVEGIGPDTEIRQVTADTPVFYAIGRSRLVFRNLATYGEGAWSSGWTGNEGHDDRGIELVNCPDFLIENTRHRNHALAGIALLGSCSGRVVRPWIEGTHAYSTPLAASQNFQMGIFISYGPAAEAWGHIRVEHADVSGTAQGILVERGSAADTGNVEIVAPYLHDIPGQHGLYIQAPNVQVVAPKVRTVGLSAVKVQTGLSAVSDITNISVTEGDFAGGGGNGFELGGLDETYSIRNVRMSGRAVGFDRAVSIVGLVDDAILDVSGQTIAGHGVFVGDSSALVPHRVRVRFVGRDIAKHGVYISSASATGIEIEPDLRTVGVASTGTYSGVLAEGAFADLTIFNPKIIDTGADMLHGIYASNAANVVKVFGRCEISGYTSTAIRATGRITQFPESAEIGATVTVGYTDQSTVRSTGPVRRALRTVNNSAATLWSETLDDEGVYLVRAELVGKLEGGAEFAVYDIVAAFYRNDNSGGTTIAVEGTPDVVATTATGSFAGVVAWDVSGSNARLRVHSGATANVDWQVRVTVVRMAGVLA